VAAVQTPRAQTPSENLIVLATADLLETASTVLVSVLFELYHVIDKFVAICYFSRVKISILPFPTLDGILINDGNQF
jgi:hypothetical protein